MQEADNKKLVEGIGVLIPLGDGRCAPAHLIKKDAPIFFMVAYDIAASRQEIVSADWLSFGPAIFEGNFFTVLIERGRWENVGLRPISPAVRTPSYIVMINGVPHLEDWDRECMRVAANEDLTRFSFRANHGPIMLENALRAHFGTGPSKDAYVQLRPTSPLTAAAQLRHLSEKKRGTSRDITDFR